MSQIRLHLVASLLLSAALALPSLAADKLPKNCAIQYNGSAKHCDQPSSWFTVAKWDKDFN